MQFLPFCDSFYLLVGLKIVNTEQNFDQHWTLSRWHEPAIWILQTLVITNVY